MTEVPASLTRASLPGPLTLAIASSSPSHATETQSSAMLSPNGLSCISPSSSVSSISIASHSPSSAASASPRLTPNRRRAMRQNELGRLLSTYNEPPATHTQTLTLTVACFCMDSMTCNDSTMVANESEPHYIQIDGIPCFLSRVHSVVLQSDLLAALQSDESLGLAEICASRCAGSASGSWITLLDSHPYIPIFEHSQGMSGNVQIQYRSKFAANITLSHRKSRKRRRARHKKRRSRRRSPSPEASHETKQNRDVIDLVSESSDSDDNVPLALVFKRQKRVPEEKDCKSSSIMSSLAAESVPISPILSGLGGLAIATSSLPSTSNNGLVPEPAGLIAGRIVPPNIQESAAIAIPSTAPTSSLATVATPIAAQIATDHHDDDDDDPADTIPYIRRITTPAASQPLTVPTTVVDHAPRRLVVPSAAFSLNTHHLVTTTDQTDATRATLSTMAPMSRKKAISHIPIPPVLAAPLSSWTFLASSSRPRFASIYLKPKHSPSLAL